MSDERLQVCNSWDQCQAAGGDRILISYHPTDNGSGGRSWYFSVIRLFNGVEISTDKNSSKNSSWYEYGRKSFSGWAVERGSMTPVEHKKAVVALAGKWVAATLRSRW